MDSIFPPRVRAQRPSTTDSSIVKCFTSAKSLIFSGREALNRPRPTRRRAGDPQAKTLAIQGQTAPGPASALLGSRVLYRPTDQPSDRPMDRFGFGRMGNYSVIGCVASLRGLRLCYCVRRRRRY